MRIETIRTHLLTAPISEPFAFSQRWVHERVALIVEVVAEGGLVGWGECYGPPRLLQPVIERFYAPLLVGHDALAGAAHWERLYNELRDHGQRGLAVQALAGLDVALWDLRGKAAGLPIHRLMGGPLRSSARAYATGLYRKTDDTGRNRALLVEEAQGYAADGFGAMKLKVGFDPVDDAANTEAIRAAIGDGIGLMIDANHGFDRIDALALARRVEPLGIGWFEEPVAPEDVAGYRWLAGQTAIPIAGGECSFTRFDFQILLANGAVDVVQPDTCAAGGLTECLRIAALANAAGVRYHPHVWGTGIAIATALHLIAMLPAAAQGLWANEPWLEFDRTPHPFRDAIVKQPFRLEQGRVAVPTGPGLGIEIDRDALARFRTEP
ncbi:MAG: mandelate racemase/muconate lactonizing enzyme family protein [Geminicoccaceae bacterium]|nr:MAG: mandelate racemase/muconate lactonizing enzyme family protein [Geminicoccaceae bacterium]